MRKEEIKIVVSHSGKQHVHQLLYGLQVNKYKYRFYTSFWYTPSSFPFNLLNFFPDKIKRKVLQQLKKRYFEKLDEKNISQLPIFELIREISDKVLPSKFSEKLLFYRDRIHDRWVAKNINKEKCDIIIGYEECCELTFIKARENNIITILDLAQIHFNSIEEIGNKFEVFGETFHDKQLRAKINKVKRRELDHSDYIICLSEFSKKSLIQNGISENKLFLVRLGFDPLKFTPKDSYQNKGKLRLVFCGTLTRRKGIDLLLKLKQDLFDKVDLTIIGPLGDASGIIGKFDTLFTWYPYVEQKELNALFQNSDVFVFPSYLDSWGMVVLEAMACGLPVIVTDNTGASDIVDEKCGFIIPTGEYGTLREKTVYFIENRSEVERMGKNSRKKALDFTWESYYGQIDEIIKEILNKRRKI